MYRGFRAEIQRFLVFLAACFFLGFLFGYMFPALLLGTGLYLSWVLWKIRQLDRWLAESSGKPPPDSGGIWGQILDRLYRLQKSQQSERRNLHKVIARIREATAALRDGVVLLDRQGGLEWWNPSAKRLLGLRPSDRLQPLVNFVRAPEFIHYFDHGKFSEPLEISSPINDHRMLQFQITTYGAGERLMIVRDITRLRNLEQMRKDFVANVSHELRTPLTVINGYIETLLDSMAGEKPVLTRALQQMQQQGGRMKLLVDDLLMLSQLEAADNLPQQEPVNLNKLLTMIHNDAESLNDDKNQQISLTLDDNVDIVGDFNELRSAVSNLVFNAVKYTPADGNINLRLWKDDKGVHVAVSDDGQGIDEKHLPRLTERFYRVDGSRATETGGTGLGLAIVKHVLIRHDSELGIESALGKGSTFTCHFPENRIYSTRKKA